MEYGCGQCTPCRVNRSRQWTGRILLESYEHPASSFVTLTYNEEEVPKDGSLSRRALQLFFKRLRQELYPRQIRYYAVGEYGEKKGRPHYHAIVFGLCMVESEVVKNAWSRLDCYDINGIPIFVSLGHVYMGDVTSASTSYVAGYMVKNMNKMCRCKMEYGRKWKKQVCLVNGKIHEFSFMSRGIGKGAVDRYVAAYKKTGIDGIEAPIHQSFRTEGKLYGFGRHLKGKIMEKMEIGVDVRQAYFEALKEKVWKSKSRSIGSVETNIIGRKNRVVYEAGKIAIAKSKRRKIE